MAPSSVGARGPWAVPLLIYLLAALREAAAACYFPAELQGNFLMQSTVTAGSQVQYSALNISADSIPIWGHCHRRIGTNVLLMDDSGGVICIRCFHLSLRSRNVLSVLTEGLDKCYTTEEAAVCNCPEKPPGLGRHGVGPQCPKAPPLSSSSPERHFQEILLFKTSGVGGDVIQSEYCPLDGRFAFSYTTNDDSDGRVICQGHESEMENCPVGSGLHFRFRGCSMWDHNITYQCLGHWPGPNNQRYLALAEASSTKKTRARYRCALYREDPATDIISMAFSSDSTCSSDLRSATDGFETMRLSPQTPLHWPQTLEPSPCLFPKWAQGHWEHIAVEGNTMVFRDHRTFTTYTFRCLSSDDGTGERSLIFGRTQCFQFKFDTSAVFPSMKKVFSAFGGGGSYSTFHLLYFSGEEVHTCIWMKQRGINVLEFQLGLRSSPYINDSLCMNSNFRDDAWLTQGRVEVLRESPCPIAGEYTGFIPDDSGLCAKLYSDCSRPEIMYYRVSSCTPEPEIYEGSRRGVPFMSNNWPSMLFNPTKVGSGIFHIADSPSSAKANAESFVPAFSQIKTPLRNADIHLTSSNRPTFSDSMLPPNYPQYYPKTSHRSTMPNNPHHEQSAQNSHLMLHLMPPEPLRNYSSRYEEKTLEHSLGVRLKRGTSDRDSMEWEDFETEYDPWTFPKLHGHRDPKERTTNKPTSVPFQESALSPTTAPSLKFQHQLPPLVPPSVSPYPFHSSEATRDPKNPILSSADKGLVANPCLHNLADSFNLSPSRANSRFLKGQAERCISSSRDPRLPDATARKMEEREYRCLGQWEENGVMYTYTQRRDIGGFECFVGSIVSSSEIYIKEAGEHCQRNVNPLLDGMKLTKRGSCQSLHENNGPGTFTTVRPYPTNPWFSSKKTPLPTKPWKPITGSPKGQEGVQNAVQKTIGNIFSILCVVALSLAI